MRTLRVIFAGIFLISLTALSSFAQNQIDLSFNPMPTQGITSADGKGQVVQADGKVIVWGMTLNGSLPNGQLLRLNANGSLDGGFNYCGCDLATIRNVQLQPDGRILVSGADAASKAKMVRVNSDGTVDPSYNPVFTTDQFATSWARVWAVLPDGKSLVEKGQASGPNFAPKILYRYNPDGSLDGSFNTITISPANGSSGAVEIKIAPDGKIVLAGVVGVGIGSHGYLNRYNADGTPDGSWTSPTFTINGSTSAAWIYGIDVLPDSSVIAGGQFHEVNGIQRFSFVKLMPAGNVDLNFVSSAFTTGRYVKALSGGQILVSAGVGASFIDKFYRLNSDGSQDAGFAKSNSISAVLNKWVVDAAGNIVFFGENNQAVKQFYRLLPDGTLDSSFNSVLGEFGKVHSIVRQSDGHIVVAGIYTSLNGTSRAGIGRLNSDGTLDGSFDPGTGFNAAPKSMIVQPDGKILAVGTFTSYNGTPRTGLARLNSDGSLDGAFSSVISGITNNAALQPDGKIVIVGSFNSVNSAGRTGAARLNSDGTLDGGFNPILGGSLNVKAVLVQADGKIVIGGGFSGVNGFNRSGMARLNSDGTTDASFTYGGAPAVNGALLQTDGKFIVFGSTIVRINSNGNADGTFVSPTLSSSDSQPRINSVLIQADGSLVVGGFFNFVNNAPRKSFVRLRSSGLLDGSFFPAGANAEVRALTGQPDGKIIVGGDFTTLQNTNRAGIARISTVPVRNLPFDFDGDGRADMGVFRPSEGNWYLFRSQSGFQAQNFGLSGDVITPGDFDGDGKSDLAIYRPSTGTWWYASSSNGGFYAVGFGFAGVPGDIPLAEDFDGDGKSDFVVYRPAVGIWFRLGTTAGYSPLIFGQAGDIPLVADMDGDGKTDPTIFRPSTGTWWYRASSTGIDVPVQWGMAGDIPVPADYDGDGKSDTAIYRPSTGSWYIVNSGNGSFTLANWGLDGDKPVAADYDGDGRADIAVYRPSNGVWFIFQSTAGFTGMQFGLATDKAVPNAFLP